MSVSVLSPKGGTESNRCEKVINSARLTGLQPYILETRFSTEATYEIINSLNRLCRAVCSQVSEIKTKLLMSALLEVH